MIEVAPRLFVGNQIDYEKHVKGKVGWSIVHAAKEPYHRQALGYKGHGCDRNDAEYLYAYRDNRLILNMIDAPKPEFFRDEMIEAALGFIRRELGGSNNVLVHCNQGGSRAPSLALLYLREADPAYQGLAFEDAEVLFQEAYPSYAPAPGIREYVKQRWGGDEARIKTAAG